MPFVAPEATETNKKAHDGVKFEHKCFNQEKEINGELALCGMYLHHRPPNHLRWPLAVVFLPLWSP